MTDMREIGLLILFFIFIIGTTLAGIFDFSMVYVLIPCAVLGLIYLLIISIFQSWSK